MKPVTHNAFSTPVAYSPPVFQAHQDTEYCSYMKEYGYVVVKVLTDEQVEVAENEFWNEMTNIYGWNREDPRTWELRRDVLTMAARTDCGHVLGWDFSSFRLNMLKQPAVSHVFRTLTRHICDASITPDDPMIASFNSLNIFRPHGVRQEWRTTSDPWYHIDNPKPDVGVPLDRQQYGFNGALNLIDVSSETGGFVCVPKSHLMFGEGSCDRDSKCGYLTLDAFTNYIKSDANERTGNTRHTQPILVCTSGQRGCLILFDPRLVHCSTSSIVPDEVNERAKRFELLRLSTFICMVPRKWASGDTLIERTRLIARRECIHSHFPHKIVVNRRQPAVSFCESIYEDDAIKTILGIV